MIGKLPTKKKLMSELRRFLSYELLKAVEEEGMTDRRTNNRPTTTDRVAHREATLQMSHLVPDVIIGEVEESELGQLVEGGGYVVQSEKCIIHIHIT